MGYDCLVLGLGGFGSSVLAHLATRGVRVLGLDRFPPAHRFGSSHGKTRIIRKAYFEHPDYVPLLQRSYQLWRELEEETGESLYCESGLLLSGPGAGETIAGAKHAAQLHQLRLEEVPATDLAARFPGFRFPEDHSVLFEPEAGYLRVEDCVLAHLRRAEQAGAETCFGETVQRWSATQNGVRIETKTEVFDADKLVIAAGAWSSQLIADVLPELRVLRKIQIWCPIDPGQRDLVIGNPAFYFDLPDGAIYGFPSQEGQTVKLAAHHGGELVDDPLRVEMTCRQSDRTPIEKFVSSHMNGVLPRIVDHAVCMYTMSPDEHFLIDRHPEYSNVFLAAGFSGHGFKFTSVIGEALADLATTGSTSLPIRFLSLDRFS